jgi:hypothetical protein
MPLNRKKLTKDLINIDIEDIISSWQWLLGDIKDVVLITSLGDMFLVGKDGAIYWLQTDLGTFCKVADDIEKFQQYLEEDDKIDNWLLPVLVDKLINEGKVIKENEVYSYKIPPILGGKYTLENIEPTDISLHFTFAGQICEQVKDLPDRTKVKNVILKTKTEEGKR